MNECAGLFPEDGNGVSDETCVLCGQTAEAHDALDTAQPGEGGSFPEVAAAAERHASPAEPTEGDG
jgi:hypothetical protein